MGCLRGCEGGYEVMSYTYAELTQIANIGTARIIEDSRGIYLLNVMQNIIWKRFDWRFTQANLAPFWLIPYEQDYGRPIVVVPDNMEKIMRAQIVGWNTTGVPVINKVDPRRELDPTNLIGLPQQISFNSSSRALRMWPRPGGSHCAPDFMVTANNNNNQSFQSTGNGAPGGAPLPPVGYDTMVTQQSGAQEQAARNAADASRVKLYGGGGGTGDLVNTTPPPGGTTTPPPSTTTPGTKTDPFAGITPPATSGRPNKFYSPWSPWT